RNATIIGDLREGVAPRTAETDLAEVVGKDLAQRTLRALGDDGKGGVDAKAGFDSREEEVERIGQASLNLTTPPGGAPPQEHGGQDGGKERDREAIQDQDSRSFEGEDKAEENAHPGKGCPDCEEGRRGHGLTRLDEHPLDPVD